VADDNQADQRLAARYRIQFAFGALLLTLLLAPSLIHSAAAIGTLRNLPALWLPADMPIRTDFFQFVDDFDVTDTILVSWPAARLDDPSVDTAMNWLEPLSSEINQDQPIPQHVRQNKDYAAILEISDGGYPFRWVRSGNQIVDRLTSPPLNLTRSAAANRLRGSLVGSDGRQTCLILSLDLRTFDKQKELLPLIRQGIAQSVGLVKSEVVLVGGPVDGAAIDGAAIRSIARFSLPSSLIAAILCLLCLRSFILSGTIVAIAMISQGMVLAAIYYAGYDLNAVLIILPALVFVLTISSGIHLSNYFREALAKDDASSRVSVVRQAMSWGYRPCTMSVLTTVVGLLSLLLVRIQPVQLFGVAASGALLFSLGMLFLMLPGAMLLVRRKPAGMLGVDPEKNLACPPVQTVSALTAFFELPLRHRKFVFFVFATLTFAAASGLPQLRSSVRVPDMFAEESELNQDYEWFEQNIGPTLTGELLVSFDKDEESDPLERLEVVKALHVALAQADGIQGINSGVTFLPNLSSGGGLAKVTARAVVRSLIRSESSLLYEYGFLRQKQDEEIWRLTFRLLQTESVPADERLASIERQTAMVLQSLSPDQRPRMAITGHVVIVQKSQKILLEDLVRSFFAALVVIAIFMSIMVGNVVGGLLSMIPNMIPTLVLFGTMGWAEYSLDIGSVMTASVAMGIAVDDTLHLLSHFRASRKRGFTQFESARDALNCCGVAMLQTTLICGCALSIYYASEFRPTQRFAVFMGVLLTMAWLGVAVLLPAMMTSRVGRWLGSR
jgi:predicted RND superfamily exporter protein